MKDLIFRLALKFHVILLICAGSVCAAAAGDAVVRPVGKRVMFLGDSITHGGYCLYYLQLMENLRHPGSTTRYYNAGYSGATVEVGIRNCNWEVDRIKPDCAFLMFGMNDVHWSEYPTDEVMADEFEGKANYYIYLYRLAYPGLLKSLMETNGVQDITLVTPTPYDEYSETIAATRRRNVSEFGLKKAAIAVRDIAAANALPVVELNDPMTAICKTHPEEGWCGSDRVHPQRLGHLFMATRYWHAFGEDSPIAKVALSFDGMVKESENAEVSKIVKDGRSLAFDYEPRALPFPLLAEYGRLKELDPEIGKFNREMLTIDGLPRGNWQLLADGCSVGVFSAAEFKEGVNLAELQTPNQRIAMQAGDVMTALHDFDVTLRDRRVYQKDETVSESDKAEQERLYQELAAFRPVVCRMEIRPSGWFNANIESYQRWPEDANLAYGGRWTDGVLSIPESIILKEPGSLAVSYDSDLDFEADAPQGLSSGVEEITVCSEVRFDAYDLECLPSIDAMMKCAVTLVVSNGIGRYYGIAKVGDANMLVALDGPPPAPEGQKVMVCITIKRGGNVGALVSYSIDGTCYRYQGSADIPVAMADDVVRSVGYIGEGAVCRLFASFEKTSRGLILVVR